jgi:drug/metabolite transporter (DMT)-like permease
MADDASPARTIAAAPATIAGAAANRRYVEAGYLFAAVGAILFSTKAVAIKFAYQDHVDAETLLALRMGLATPFYLAIGLHAVRERRQHGKPLPTPRRIAAAAAVGLLGYWVASYLDFLGLEYVSAQIERLILFTYPIFVVIFGALFFQQKITRHALIAVAISYAGLALIFGESTASGGHDALLGSGLVLACAVAFALYQLFAKNLITAIGPRLFTCIAMTAAAVGAIVQFLLTHAISDIAASGRVLATALFIAIGSTVLPSFFLNAALHRISAQANATIGTLRPVATIFLAYLVLGETLSPIAWAGTVLVIAGVGWFTLAERR